MDRAGNDVFDPIYLRHCWDGKFLEADEFLLVHGDSVTLFDVPSGRQRWTVHEILTEPGCETMIRVSPLRTSFVVFDQHTISVIASVGDLLWKRTFDDEYVIDIAIDLAGEGIVARLYNAKSRTGRFLAMTMSSPKAVGESVPSPALASSTRRDFETMWYSRNQVLQWSSLNSGLGSLELGASYMTIVADLFDSTASPVEAVDGLVIPIGPSEDGRSQLIRVSQDLRAVDFLKLEEQ